MSWVPRMVVGLLLVGRGPQSAGSIMSAGTNIGLHPDNPTFRKSVLDERFGSSLPVLQSTVFECDRLFPQGRYVPKDNVRKVDFLAPVPCGKNDLSR